MAASGRSRSSAIGPTTFAIRCHRRSRSRIRAEASPARMTWELGAVSLRDATQLASRARNRLPVPEPFGNQGCTLLLVVRVENAQVLRIRPPVHARRAYVERGFAARAR